MKRFTLFCLVLAYGLFLPGHSAEPKRLRTPPDIWGNDYTKQPVTRLFSPAMRYRIKKRSEESLTPRDNMVEIPSDKNKNVIHIINSDKQPVSKNSERTLHLTADRTECGGDKKTFIAEGNAEATIDGQDSKIEADKIVFCCDKRILEAYGNVRIYREGSVTTGACFKFRIDSPDYMVTQAHVRVSDPIMKSRSHVKPDHDFHKP